MKKTLTSIQVLETVLNLAKDHAAMGAEGLRIEALRSGHYSVFCQCNMQNELLPTHKEAIERFSKFIESLKDLVE